MSDKIMIFIDGSNVYHALDRYRKKNNTPNFKIDYEKFLPLISAGRNLVRAYYYGSRDESNPDAAQESFFKKLQFLGIQVSIKPVKKRKRICKNCGAIHETKLEKGVDVALATDLLSLAARNGYDTAIIVSGDNDFLCAIDEVKRLAKRIELVAFEDSINQDTRLCADRFTSLDVIAMQIRL